MVGRARIQRQGLLRHQHREQFTPGHLDERRTLHILGVAPCTLRLVVCKRQNLLIPHERQIPHDGLGRNLQLLRQFCANGWPAFGEDAVNLEHPRNRRTGGREDGIARSAGLAEGWGGVAFAPRLFWGSVRFGSGNREAALFLSTTRLTPPRAVR